MDPKTAVPGNLGVHDNLMAHPPVVEAHGEAHQLYSISSQLRDDGNIEDLLLRVGIEGEQDIGVLGKVMCAMILPKGANIVH